MSIRGFETRSVMVRGVVGLCCVLLAPGNAMLAAQTPAAPAPNAQAAAPQAGVGAAETAPKLTGDQLDALAEASHVSGQSVPALKSLLHRAMQTLRTTMKGGRDA